MNVCVDLPVLGPSCFGSVFAKFNGAQLEPYHIGVLIFCAAIVVVAIQMLRGSSA